jgi:hypothetical protein
LKTLNAIVDAVPVPEPIKPSLAAFTRLYESRLAEPGRAPRHCA